MTIGGKSVNLIRVTTAGVRTAYFFLDIRRKVKLIKKKKKKEIF